jgi:hypothetical protein
MLMSSRECLAGFGEAEWLFKFRVECVLCVDGMSSLRLLLYLGLLLCW